MTKRLLLFILSTWTYLISFAQGYMCNSPLPFMPVKLDILFIGNSFSIDTSAALPELFNTMGVSNVNVYVLYKPACSMEQHYKLYKSGDMAYELYLYNIRGEQSVLKKCSIRDVMRMASWDVVIFQQFSGDSGDYTTYEPYLSKLIQAYNITKISPRTTFAFNQTWAYAPNHKGLKRYTNQEGMYNKITETCKKMVEESGINIVIPCGTAVENARACKNLKSKNSFTRDNQHIDLYQGRYLLACTFFESIIAPCLRRNLREDFTIYGPKDAEGQVNNSNRRSLQNCARLAVANNYEVSEFVNE